MIYVNSDSVVISLKELKIRILLLFLNVISNAHGASHDRLIGIALLDSDALGVLKILLRVVSRNGYRKRKKQLFERTKEANFNLTSLTNFSRLRFEFSGYLLIAELELVNYCINNFYYFFIVMIQYCILNWKLAIPISLISL